ncbi:hypothetical protein D3C76_1454370 [compost metagenome]
MRRVQAELLDQLPRQGRYFEYPALRRRPRTGIAADIQAAHFGLPGRYHFMFGIGRNPHAPLRRGEVATVAGIHAQYAADGIGKLYPVMAVAGGPGASAQAFGTGIKRPGQVVEGRDGAGVSDARHDGFL